MQGGGKTCCKEISSPTLENACRNIPFHHFKIEPVIVGMNVCLSKPNIRRDMKKWSVLILKNIFHLRQTVHAKQVLNVKTDGWVEKMVRNNEVHTKQSLFGDF